MFSVLQGKKPTMFIYLFIYFVKQWFTECLKKQKSVNIAATGSDTPQFMELL